MQVDPATCPAEVDLRGRCFEAKCCWDGNPRNLEQLCAEMVASDLALFERTKYLREG